MRRRLVAVWLTLCFAVPAFGYMIDPRGYAWPYAVLDGVDTEGHVLYVKQIGEIKWREGSFPIVVRWNSGDEGSSPILGAGWSLPIAESRIIPIDENRLEMRLPDGCLCRFARNPKKPYEIQSGVHRWIGRISGERIDVWSHPDAPGAVGGNETRMRFQKGRLMELRMWDSILLFRYNNGVLSQVLINGKVLLNIVQPKNSKREWVFEFKGGMTVFCVLGKMLFPTATGVREKDTLMEVRFSGATPLVFTYAFLEGCRSMFSVSGKDILWDTRRRTILEKDGWKYEIGEAKPGGNTRMRRINPDGEIEQDFFDVETGIRIREAVGGERMVDRRFTSGKLCGKTRWRELYLNGVLNYRIELSYDDVGREVYSKYVYGPASAGRQGTREFWFDDRGHILLLRENQDKATDQEYIYTPDGINVGVVCGDRIVSAQVSNIDEFVKWFRAEQRGEKYPCPKYVSIQDAPWPDSVREQIPDWLFKSLTDSNECKSVDVTGEDNAPDGSRTVVRETDNAASKGKTGK